MPKLTIKKRTYYGTSNGLDFPEPSLTQQQYKEECNVCRQIERLTQHLEFTGDSLSDVVNKGAMYGDFSDVPDFRTYNNLICDAKEKFDNLNPKVKDKFNNNPLELFDFLSNTDNKEEAIKLGLINAPVVKDIVADLKADLKADNIPEGSSPVGDTP